MKMRRFLRCRVLGNNKGFTLLELLAVIALIGILAGLVVPRVASSRDEATQKTIEANVQMLQAAVERYHFDNGKYPNDGITDWIGELYNKNYISTNPSKIKDSDNYILSTNGVVSYTP
ncbi:competence type IV pilus major pilin ComGC [Moorella sulfitireducens (nom. illeg.)]|uniref:competence type IV pilus major pilin ComGC n=1 Tax=Neomoorella sulfitireducens TaxID=2972948 RepID=UPI0021AD3D96|nr:prepilin-type N-terminal cleavage/methylation domain-containing protein [Moorella sulfitireducens]